MVDLAQKNLEAALQEFMVSERAQTTAISFVPTHMVFTKEDKIRLEEDGYFWKTPIAFGW